MVASEASGGCGRDFECTDEALAGLDKPCGEGWLPRFLRCVNTLPPPPPHARCPEAIRPPWGKLDGPSALPTL